MQNHVAYAEQAEGIQPDFGKGKWKQAAQPSQCTGQERVHGDGVKLGEPGHCPGTESQQAGDSGQNQAGCKKSKRTDFFSVLSGALFWGAVDFNAALEENAGAILAVTLWKNFIYNTCLWGMVVFLPGGMLQVKPGSGRGGYFRCAVRPVRWRLWGTGIYRSGQEACRLQRCTGGWLWGTGPSDGR